MTDIMFTLRRSDGSFSYEELEQAGHVPRAGETVAFDPDGPVYRVVDVIYQFGPGPGSAVTVTAYEHDWHAHLNRLTDAWDHPDRTGA